MARTPRVPLADRSDAGSAGPSLGDTLPGGLDETSLAADWSVPWADLMMVMFVLFAVLYIYDLAERDVREAFAPFPDPARWDKSITGGSPDSDRATSEQLFEQARDAVRETDLEHVDVILEDDRSVRLSVRGPMFFELGSAELRPPTRLFLDRVAQVLRRNDRHVRVVGHTDSFPVSSERFPTNWELSAVRASTVVRHLIDHGGIDPARFTVVAHSMYRPSVANDSPENKALNRRVEIVLTPERWAPAGPSGT